MVGHVLTGIGAFISTAESVLIGCHQHGVCVAKAIHKASWNVAFGHAQTTEVVTKGGRFNVMEDWPIHCGLVI